MDPNPPKLRLDQQRRATEHATSLHRSASQTGLQFASVEAMLRHDRSATEIPATLAQRLETSLAQLPPPRPWWKRWLGLG